MNRDDAKEKFRQADRLFNERQYAPALEILAELDRMYPNQRAVLYPMARCLAGLRRLSEAIDLAERIARDFDYVPAKELKERLRDKHARISSIPPNSSISSFDPPADTPKPVKKVVVPREEDIPPIPEEPTAPAAEEEVARTPVRVAVLVCAGLVLLSYGVYAGVVATVAKPAVVYTVELAAELADKASTTEAPWQELMFLWVGFTIHLYALACLPMYAALKIGGALQHGSFGADMKDAATFTLYGFLLAPLVVIGWIVFFVLLRRGFGMSTGETVKVLALFCAMFAALYAIDWSILTFALHPILAG